MVRKCITLLSACLTVIEKHSLDQWRIQFFFCGGGGWPTFTIKKCTRKTIFHKL